jgi:head-tail adaptor
MAQPPRVRVGELRTRVRVESAGMVLSDTGGFVPGPVTVVATEIPVAIDPIPIAFQLREAQSIGGQQSALTHQIRMRYRTDIKPAMRVVELEAPGRVFEIVVPPQHDAKKRESVLLCIEKVS